MIIDMSLTNHMEEGRAPRAGHPAQSPNSIINISNNNHNITNCS